MAVIHKKAKIPDMPERKGKKTKAPLRREMPHGAYIMQRTDVKPPPEPVQYRDEPKIKDAEVRSVIKKLNVGGALFQYPTVNAKDRSKK